MKMRYLLVLAIAIAASLAAACGPGNQVRLLPLPPIQASALPPPNAPSVCVVLFADNRLDPSVVGVRRDGSSFGTNGDVAQWISRALADELARKGLRVTFALDTSQAKSGNPDYLVTGSVDEVWIKESSAMEFSASMRVNCTLANRKGKIWSERTNSSQTRNSLPAGGTADNLLLETLADLIRPMAQKIIQTVESRK